MPSAGVFLLCSLILSGQSVSRFLLVETVGKSEADENASNGESRQMDLNKNRLEVEEQTDNGENGMDFSLRGRE